MRAISNELKAHLSGEVITTAICVKLSLLNGTVKTFTTHDKQIILEGLTYKPMALSGFDNISESSEADEIKGSAELVINDIEITEADIKNNIYDNAKFEMYLVNYMDISQGKLHLKTAYFDKIKTSGKNFSVELRPLQSLLQAAQGNYYTNICRAKFCDSKCKLNANDFTVTTTITQGLDNYKFIASSLTQVAGYFNNGVVEFLSGTNIGRKYVVKEFGSSTIALKTPFKNPAASGDSFKIIRGCDKKFNTCSSVFSNAINFRGEPHIPGTDAILKTSAN